MAVIENGTYAVQSSEVATVAKTEAPLPPPSTDTLYMLMVVLKSVGDSQSPQWVFDDENARDEFYKQLVNAMGS